MVFILFKRLYCVTCVGGGVIVVGTDGGPTHWCFVFF